MHHPLSSTSYVAIIVYQITIISIAVVPRCKIKKVFLQKTKRVATDNEKGPVTDDPRIVTRKSSYAEKNNIFIKRLLVLLVTFGLKSFKISLYDQKERAIAQTAITINTQRVL